MTEQKLLTTKELARIIAAKHNITIAQAKDILDTTFSTITDSLNDNIPVFIHGFGKFSITQAKARRGRNPQTGESIEIPAKNVVRFKPSKTLKERLQ